MDAKKLVVENWPVVAIAGGLYVVGRFADDGMTAAQRAARAQTQTGAPTDKPGQVLVGEPDYIRIYKGQKVAAVQKFGANDPTLGGVVTPVTGRVYAVQTILTYWAKELTRLCGFKSGGLGAIAPDAPFDANDLSGRHAPLVAPFTFSYRGLVSLESAQALIKAWNKWAPQLRAAIFQGSLAEATSGKVLSSLTGPMTVEGAAAFWEALRGLAIDVDVDRAVPDSAGLALEAIYESAQELPGRVGELAHKIADETGNILWDLITGLVPVPYLFAALGVAGWVLYRKWA